MKNLSIITIALILIVLCGCSKGNLKQTSTPTYEAPVIAQSISERKNIRHQLELVNLGLLSLLNNQQFVTLVNDMTTSNCTSSNRVRTIDLKDAYDGRGRSLVKELYAAVLLQTEGDIKQTQAVVTSFLSFTVNETQYFPTVIASSVQDQSSVELEFPCDTEQKPEYIVNQEAPDSNVFYGYLSDGQYTYMKEAHLNTLHGWIVSELPATNLETALR